MRKPFKGTRLRYHAVDARPATLDALDARRERGHAKTPFGPDGSR